MVSSAAGATLAKETAKTSKNRCQYGTPTHADQTPNHANCPSKRHQNRPRRFRGPVGPVGPVGPKGEAGTPGLITTDPLLGQSSHSVAPNATVIFDSIVYSSGAISYNPATGVITFNDSGVFTVQFGVATDGFIGTPSPTKAMGFRLLSSQGDDCGAWSAISSGTVGRTCIIDVPVAPVTMSLANSTANTINLADVTGTQAWLTASNEETPRNAMQVELRS